MFSEKKNTTYNMLKFDIYNLKTVSIIEHFEKCLHFSHFTSSVAALHVRLSTMLFHPFPEILHVVICYLLLFICLDEKTVIPEKRETRNLIM